VGRGIHAQLDPLIAKPLQKGGKPILIVGDALNEHYEEGAQPILTLLVDRISQMPRLKISITAHPEPHIQAILDQYRGYKQFHMQGIEQSVVEGDIRQYLKFRLSEEEVTKAFLRLRPPP